MTTTTQTDQEQLLQITKTKWIYLLQEISKISDLEQDPSYLQDKNELGQLIERLSRKEHQNFTDLSTSLNVVKNESYGRFSLLREEVLLSHYLRLIRLQVDKEENKDFYMTSSIFAGGVALGFALFSLPVTFPALIAGAGFLSTLSAFSGVAISAISTGWAARKALQSEPSKKIKTLTDAAQDIKDQHSKLKNKQPLAYSAIIEKKYDLDRMSMGRFLIDGLSQEQTSQKIFYLHTLSDIVSSMDIPDAIKTDIIFDIKNHLEKDLSTTEWSAENIYESAAKVVIKQQKKWTAKIIETDQQQKLKQAIKNKDLDAIQKIQLLELSPEIQQQLKNEEIELNQIQNNSDNQRSKNHDLAHAQPTPAQSILLYREKLEQNEKTQPSEQKINNQNKL